MTYQNILFLCLFLAPSIITEKIIASNATYEKTQKENEGYKEYFEQQRIIYEELENLGIFYAHPLWIDEALAESILANQSEEVNQAIARFDNNIILHGVSGIGKTATAQAIAVKYKLPCLFFNAAVLSTECNDPKMHYADTIVAYVEKLEKRFNRPCIIILDDIQALTTRYMSTYNPKNNPLLNFYKELDKLPNSKTIVISTIDKAKDIPDGIINYASVIKMPLPTFNQRESILSYQLKRIQKKYDLTYPEWLTAAYLARKSSCFCQRDLQNLVAEATLPAILEQRAPIKNNIVSWDKSVSDAIKEIRWKYVQQWQRTCKKYLRQPNFCFATFGGAMTLFFLYNQKKALRYQKENYCIQLQNFEAQRKNLNLQEEVLTAQKNILKLQKVELEQSKKIADQQR